MPSYNMVMFSGIVLGNQQPSNSPPRSPCTYFPVHPQQTNEMHNFRIFETWPTECRDNVVLFSQIHDNTNSELEQHNPDYFLFTVLQLPNSFANHQQIVNSNIYIRCICVNYWIPTVSKLKQHEADNFDIFQLESKTILNRKFCMYFTLLYCVV